jgi:hypothetical protein
MGLLEKGWVSGGNQVNIDGLVKSPSAALRFNPALLDKNLQF